MQIKKRRKNLKKCGVFPSRFSTSTSVVKRERKLESTECTRRGSCICKYRGSDETINAATLVRLYPL